MSSFNSFLRRSWRRVRELETRHDVVLLAVNPFFIPKKLLRDSLRRIAHRARPGLLLDVGCGYGPYRHLFESDRYVGLDYNSSRGPAVVGSVLELPMRDASADTVLCTEVIEHTADPQKLCRELHRILRDDGILVLSAPMSWNLHYEPYDYYRFTPYGLRHLLEQAGFEVEHTERIGGLVSLTGARLTDVLSRRLQHAWPRLRGRNVAAALAVAPLNAAFYALGSLFDSADPTDAIGWLVIARKTTEGKK